MQDLLWIDCFPIPLMLILIRFHLVCISLDLYRSHIPVKFMYVVHALRPIVLLSSFFVVLGILLTFKYQMKIEHIFDRLEL